MKVLIYLTKDKMEAKKPTDAKPIAILTDRENTLNLVAVHPDHKNFILELISEPIMDLQTGKNITAKYNPTRWLQMFALRGTNLLLSIETVAGGKGGSKRATNPKKKTVEKRFRRDFQNLKVDEGLLQTIEAKAEEVGEGDLVVVTAPKDFTKQQLHDLELAMKMLSEKLSATILVLPEGYDAQALEERMEDEGWEKKGYTIIPVKI